MAPQARGNPKAGLWRRVRWAVTQNFVDQWILIVFGMFGGFAVLLVSISDSGQASMVRAFVCLLVPSLAISLLIAVDGLANAFKKISEIGRATKMSSLDR